MNKLPIYIVFLLVILLLVSGFVIFNNKDVKIVEDPQMAEALDDKIIVE